MLPDKKEKKYQLFSDYSYLYFANLNATHEIDIILSGTRITTSFSIESLTAGTALLAVTTLCRKSRSQCLVQSVDFHTKSTVAILNVTIIRFEALILPLDEIGTLGGE